MAKEEAPTFMIEDAHIMFRNLSGKEGPYNREGDRNFAIALDPEAAEMLANDGWNVKVREPKEEGDEPVPYLPVAVRFDILPPNIVLIKSSGRVRLDEDTVGVIDFANLELVDIIVRAYDWELNGKTGRKAYVKSMYVTIEEDDLEKKYANMGREG